MSLRSLSFAIAALAFAQYSPAEDVRTAAKTTQPLVLRNVELTQSGQLQLQVVDSHGNPLPGTKVLVASKRNVSSVLTDASGRADVAILQGGTCFFRIEKQDFACRVWMHGTAPPGALKSIAMVNNDPSIVRGNRFSRRGNCPPENCESCENASRISSDAKCGLALAGLFGTAAYFAFASD